MSTYDFTITGTVTTSDDLVQNSDETLTDAQVAARALDAALRAQGTDLGNADSTWGDADTDSVAVVIQP